ncbi:MAG TPA: hypothetical protein VF631_10085 [Allosphingosinicella sp.]|uniref:hypothetical protein n=1 Tax=Allosphingosinicella sp. TaxID=2823234 RepID=UPI002F274CF0
MATRAVIGLLFSVMVLAVFALSAGGMWLIAKRRDRKKGLLMLVAAVVLLANVGIWTL